MPIVSTNVTVNCQGTGGSATLLVNADGGSPAIPIPVTVHNPGVPTIWCGGASVTVSNGIPILGGATKDFSLTTGNNLYAIFNTVTTTVNIFKGNS